MHVQWRLDDFTPGTPFEKWNERLVIKMLSPFEAKGIPYYLGVSAGLLTSASCDVLKCLRFAQITYHGYDHGFSKWRPADESGGEFSGMSVDEIRAQIQIAKRVLERMDLYFVPVCIPPFNSFTQATLDALIAEGFEKILGGPESFRCGMHKLNFGSLQFIPSIGKYYGKAAEMMTLTDEELIAARLFALHIPWDDPDTVSMLLDRITNIRRE